MKEIKKNRFKQSKVDTKFEYFFQCISNHKPVEIDKLPLQIPLTSAPFCLSISSSISNIDKPTPTKTQNFRFHMGWGWVIISE